MSSPARKKKKKTARTRAVGKTPSRRTVGKKPSRREVARTIKALCLKAEKAREKCDHEASRAALEKALALDPQCSDAIWWLGDYWHTVGKRAPALRFYRRYLRKHPGDPEAVHMIASLGGRAAPKRASDDYLKLHFDSYAEDFDKSLVKELEYQAPAVLARLIARARGRKSARADICDLGCGTGLVGVALKDIARTLTGVDLSRGMLSKARDRGIYNRLSNSEVTRFLKGNKGAYDIVTAADVLIYIGDVTALFAAAAAALRPGGLLAISAELGKSGSYALTISGRYSHNPAWLRGLAAKNGLSVVAEAKKGLRYEMGEPVPGYYAVLRKPAR
ncbi:MAG: hypothetical protein RL477_1587 [Pseudomonadota bacterium]